MNSFFLTDNFSGDIMVDYPFLGAQYQKDKTVFRVQSEHAAGMELCLFSPDEKEEIRIKIRAPPPRYDTKQEAARSRPETCRQQRTMRQPLPR